MFPKKFPGKTKDNRNQNFTINSVETFSFCKTFYHCFFSKKHVATAKNNSNLLLYFHILVFLFMVILKGFAKNFDRIRSRSDKVVRKRNDSILCFIYYIHSAPKSEKTLQHQHFSNKFWKVRPKARMSQRKEEKNLKNITNDNFSIFRRNCDIVGPFLVHL